jgi:NADH:ubiquinone oxidoreductase subunit F (NADH-binding)
MEASRMKIFSESEEMTQRQQLLELLREAKKFIDLSICGDPVCDVCRAQEDWIERVRDLERAAQ